MRLLYKYLKFIRVYAKSTFRLSRNDFVKFCIFIKKIDYKENVKQVDAEKR